MTNVAMITRDRYNLLEQAIRTLLASCGESVARTSTRPFTLLVLDDGSTDNRCQRLLQSLPKSHCDLLVYRNSSHWLGELKTSAVEASRGRFGRGDWLCIADNDTFWLAGWLERMEQMAEASEPYGFRLWGGQNHPAHQLWPVVKQPPTSTADGPLFSDMRECETLAGTHMFMRWDTWDLFGPMVSDGPGVLMGEDVRFCRKVRESGGRIGVASPPVVIDAGITSSNGQPSPGAVEKAFTRVPGVIYE